MEVLSLKGHLHSLGVFLDFNELCKHNKTIICFKKSVGVGGWGESVVKNNSVIITT